MSETSTRRSPAVGTRPVALLTALQLGTVGTYWYLGERVPRTHLVRLIDDIVLYVAAPLFAGLALLGLLTLVRGVPPGHLRRGLIVGTAAALLTCAFATFLDALIFLGPPFG